MKLLRASLLSLNFLLAPVAFAQQQQQRPAAGPEETSARLARTAVVAVTAHALAELPGRIAPQLERDAVGDLLRKANLEEFLKSVGVCK